MKLNSGYLNHNANVLHDENKQVHRYDLQKKLNKMHTEIVAMAKASLVI